MPLLSVIVPNYNHEPFLQKRLESIFNQTYQDFEVILLDDCSTDNSVELLKEYATHPKVSHFIINVTNSGSPFKQWKKGIDLAIGKYIWIAESDDWAEVTFLENMFLRLEDGIGLVYCRTQKIIDSRFINEYWPDGLDPMRWKRDFYNDGLNEIKNYLVYRNTIPTASACVFEKALVEIPIAMLNMRFNGDWLFWVYLLKKTRLYYVSEILCYHRFHENASRAKMDKMHELKRLYESVFNIMVSRKTFQLGKIRKEEQDKYNWLINHYFNSRLFLEFKGLLSIFPFLNVVVIYLGYIKRQIKRIVISRFAFVRRYW